MSQKLQISERQILFTMDVISLLKCTRLMHASTWQFARNFIIYLGNFNYNFNLMNMVLYMLYKPYIMTKGILNYRGLKIQLLVIFRVIFWGIIMAYFLRI